MVSLFSEDNDDGSAPAVNLSLPHVGVRDGLGGSTLGDLLVPAPARAYGGGSGCDVGGVTGPSNSGQVNQLELGQGTSDNNVIVSLESENVSLTHGKGACGSDFACGDMPKGGDSVPEVFGQKNSQNTRLNYRDAVRGESVNRVNPICLQFHKPKVVGSRRVVCPPKSADVREAETWKFCLVGYLIGKALPYSVVNLLAKKLWAKLGLVEVLLNDNEFVFFKFKDEDSCIEVLESGPWHLSGRLVCLSRWRQGMVLQKATHNVVPVWAKFYNVPLEHWNPEGFSHIASAVGKPLHVDSLTYSKKRIYYMRMCIEVNAAEPIIDEFDLQVGGDEEREISAIIEVKVEYQGLPRVCSLCCSCGHSEPTCPRQALVLGGSVEAQVNNPIPSKANLPPNKPLVPISREVDECGIVVSPVGQN